MKAQEHSTDLVGKLTRYSALAGAAGLASTAGQAGIKVWTPTVNNVAQPSDPLADASVYFDFETGTVSNSPFLGADFRLVASNYKSPLTDPYASTFNYFYAVKLGPNLVQRSGTSTLSASSAARLASGGAINGVQNFVTATSWALLASASTDGFVAGNWSAGGTGYLGLKFDLGGNAHYGWAEINLENLDADFLPKLTLNRFGYNTIPGEGLTAGLIPEPESLLPMALLALGAAGLVRYRRQRRAKAETTSG